MDEEQGISFDSRRLGRIIGVVLSTDLGWESYI